MGWEGEIIHSSASTSISTKEKRFLMGYSRVKKDRNLAVLIRKG